MKKGEIYEGTVERIEFPNKGVVMIDGEKAIVKNALPGQKIRFRINKKARRSMRGHAFGGCRALKVRDGRGCMPAFWYLRRMSLSADSV